MRIIRSVAEMAAWRQQQHRDGVTVALVPTMGALHAGHAALIRAARLSCDAVVVSLFVNPSQFDDRRDLARYPRRFTEDQALCRKAGVDVLFAPSVQELYPPGFQTTVGVPELAMRWEGEYRPGHFAGVATIVTKLFGLIQPHRAFFGQKDYQQSLLVRRLAVGLNCQVAIEVMPTVREPDGLALSSRNARLTAGQRRRAPVLHRALTVGAQAIRRGERAAKRIIGLIQACIDSEQAVRTDYVAVCDPETLEPVDRLDRAVVLLGAIQVGGVRLIDNVLVTPPARPSRRAGGRSAGAARAPRRGRA